MFELDRIRTDPAMIAFIFLWIGFFGGVLAGKLIRWARRDYD